LKKTLSIAALLVVSSVHSDTTVTVPFQFSSGEVASASQVNANFAALASAITTLQSQLGLAFTPTALNVTQTPQPLGTTVTVDGVPYIITRTSIPAFATDTRVWVDVPVPLGSDVSSAISVSSSVQGGFSALQASKSPLTATINGINIGCSEGFFYFVDPSSGTSGTSPRSGEQAYSQSLSCTAQIDSNTRLSLGFQPQSNATVTGTSPTPADFSNVDPYAVTPLAARRAQIQADLRSLLAYVVFSTGH